MKKLKVLKEISEDPVNFLTNRYYSLRPPKGFRIELFTARKYNQICSRLTQFNLTHFKETDSYLEKGISLTMIPVKKLKGAVKAHSPARPPEKTFCPYCEKYVVPRRLHKLDPGDIVISLFTAGFWVIFILVMYLFIRRCPVCNYNLRGFKPISRNK